ncbi:MAG: enoyl-CoA hydratase-related protein, partial [Celeribacter marinus]
MAYSTIKTDTKNSVTLIRLDRPDALNALNSELLGELATALSAADADPKVRAIVITGSEKAFAAGADIKEMSEKTFAEMALSDFFAAEANTITAIRKPIIAAVAG